MSSPAPPSIISLLPNETLTSILVGLPYPLLAHLTRVSRRFNAVAERVLYASIYIRDVLSDGADADAYPWRTLRCCKSLIHRPHLFESVQGFHIRWVSVSGASPSSFHLSETLAKLSEALPHLVYLDSLELSLGPANMVHPHRLHPIECVIAGCRRLPHLRSCVLGAEWTKGVQPYSGVLPQFLLALPALQHLKLADHHGALHLPPTVLPHLSTFRGSPDAAASLLPGRPVHSLSLIGQDSDVTRENLPRLAHTAVPLRFLDLTAMSVRPILLRNVATYLPTVEVIRIRLALRHTLHYALSGIRLLTGLASVLGSFQRLTHLDLSPTIVTVAGTIPHSTATDELGLCREWARACPSLRRVIFPSQTEWGVDSLGTWTIIDSTS
ncbi:hypothetical protein CPB85DRAFT_1389650 [Mucidula mucida]|nr:hypothetical protein CPB85DRAFT_1389650 [Mucidula mucida]